MHTDNTLPPSSTPASLLLAQQKKSSTPEDKHSKQKKNASQSTPPSTEAIARAIERKIIENHLAPGTPLPSEATFCAEFGVSRSVIRETVRVLQALEIVQVKRGKGMFVGEMSLRPMAHILLTRAQLNPESIDALTEIIAVRRILDLGSAREVVTALAGTHNKDLHDIVVSMTDKADRDTLFTEEDIAFHTILMERMGNVLNQQLMQTLWLIHMESLRSLDLVSGDMRTTAHAHAAMLDAAERGDVDAYRYAVDAHYAPLITKIEHASDTA